MHRNKTSMVLGLLFTMDRSQVLLLEKTRPSWQCGKLNGVGGHVDPGEIDQAAMRREAIEEVGIDVEWSFFGSMSGPDWKVLLYRAFSDKALEARQAEDQPPRLVPVASLPSNVVGNIRWLVPYALNDQPTDPVHIHVEYPN